MEIGDFGYLIFLIIVAIANLLRNARKKKEEQAAPSIPKRSGGGQEDRTEGRRIPRPVGEERTEAGRGQPRESGGAYTRMNRPAQQSASTAPEDAPEEEAPWERMVEELFGELQEASPDSAPSAARSRQRRPQQQKPATESLRADGYREGESLTVFAERLRQEGRIKLQQRHLDAAEEGPLEAGIRFDFSGRDAVLYDAIWRRPYA